MPDPQTIGRYQILSEIGHGAMGSVYRAQDPAMDRTVAIKTILAAALTGPLAQEYRERFIREARAAGRLTHPGIVAVYDVSEQDGMPYLVMEYVAGRSLAAAMDASERFSFDRIYELGNQLADAIGYAHRNGVIHRDIKPANILLAAPGPGEQERAKIADLGVAKLTASQITTTGQLLGTPAFMPPEQFTGAPIDGRADLFSLGVILYWLATGDKPFAGDTITAVSYKIVHSEPAPPRRINPAVPVALERIIMKCLEKDPATRYTTGEALAADLAAARAGRDLMQTAAPSQRTAASAVLAPVAAMSGDPNSTLDSDARLHLAEAGYPSAPHASAQVPPPAKRAGRFGTFQIVAVTAAIGLLLLGGDLAYSVVRHRRQLRAEAEAQAQAQADAQAQALAKAQADALAQAAQTNSALQSDQQQSGQSTAENSPASTSGSSTAGASSKKSAAKPPSNRTSSGKPASNPPQPIGTNSSAAPTPAAAAPQPVAPPSNTSAASMAPAAKPPTPASPNPVAPTPVTKSDAAPSADSAKLHIDDGHVPNSASFVVMMDGKQIFQRKSVAEGAENPKIEDQSVPPGEHEFRVVTAAGGVQIGISNTVKEAFQAKKKMTLRIELRDNSTGQTLKKNSHIDAGASVFVLSLKATGLLGF